jgi:Leucine-rich repeat (LRR) protein
VVGVSGVLCDKELSSLHRFPFLRTVSTTISPYAPLPPATNVGFSEFRKLANLESLYVNCNAFDDESLKLLDHCTELEKLSLERVQLTTLKNIPKLQKLNELILELPGKEFQGLDGLENVCNLRKLSIGLSVTVYEQSVILPNGETKTSTKSKCQAVSLGPLAELQQLESLSLVVGLNDSCELKNLSKLPRLKSLKLQAMPFADQAVQHLAALTHLRELEVISNGRFSSGGLTQICKLSNLRKLNLESCFSELLAQDVKSLENLKNLESLKLSYAGLTDDALQAMPILPELVELDLAGNQLSDASMTQIHVKCPRLEQLRIDDNRGVTADGLKVVASQPSIRDLSFDENQCPSNSERDAILNGLQMIHLSRNHSQDEILTRETRK